MRRIPDLYDHPPADGRVLCVDESGPLNLQPRPGRAWRPVAYSVRLRATYTHGQGGRPMIAALGDYIRWRNQRARPKTGFATDYKIRHPDHPFKAALTRH